MEEGNGAEILPFDNGKRARVINFIEDVLGEVERNRFGSMMDEWLVKAERLGWDKDQALVALDMFLVSIAWDNLLHATGDQVFNTTVYEDPAAAPSTTVTQ